MTRVKNEFIGYELENGDTICWDCATPDERKREFAVYEDDYEDGKEPICVRCDATMVYIEGDDHDEDDE